MFEVNAYLSADTRGPAMQEAWFAWVLECKRRNGQTETREGFGKLTDTENRINIRAFGIMLARLRAPCRINLYTNSRHLHAVLANGWLAGWAENGWKNSSGKEIKNRDLWEGSGEWIKPHEIIPALEKEHAYSSWMRMEIKSRTEKDREWSELQKKMEETLNEEKAGEPNGS